MTLLMKKLDHLNEPIQEGQSADSSHSDVANADEEQQSTMVSQVHLNQQANNKDEVKKLFSYTCTCSR